MKMAVMLILALSLAACPAEARKRHHRANGYTDSRGVYHEYADNRGYRFDRYDHEVHEHKQRRNVLLGVGAVGLLTGSRAASILGLGGAAANEVVDRRHRDW